MSKVWFITGASRGFGREWAEAALERGDQVAATARRPEALDALVDTYHDNVLPLKLDVTDRAADRAAVEQAAGRFGRLDVVINNAGYGHFGMVEELTEDELRRQLETNLFGAVWVTQAALPIMREQGSGHIIQVSSIGGISAFPTVGAYHASKVGSGGSVPVAVPGGGRLRHPRHADRAGWLLHRLVRPLSDAQRGEPRLRCGARGGQAPSVGSESRRSCGYPQADPEGRRRRPAPAAGVLRSGAAGHRHEGLRVPTRHLERVATSVVAGPGLLTESEIDDEQLVKVLRKDHRANVEINGCVRNRGHKIAQ